MNHSKPGACSSVHACVRQDRQGTATTVACYYAGSDSAQAEHHRLTTARKCIKDLIAGGYARYCCVRQVTTVQEEGSSSCTLPRTTAY